MKIKLRIQDIELYNFQNGYEIVKWEDDDSSKYVVARITDGDVNSIGNRLLELSSNEINIVNKFYNMIIEFDYII